MEKFLLIIVFLYQQISVNYQRKATLIKKNPTIALSYPRAGRKQARHMDVRDYEK